MNRSPWHLPWTLRTAPHAVLDIARGCNISCRSCVNSDRPRLKAVSEVRAELDALSALRPLSSVSILGGEVTLHPDLCEIVGLVRARGLRSEVLTNGLLLDAELARRLKKAGADIVYLHIEARQVRSDLPADARPADVRRLREEKISLLAEASLDVGLAVTAYGDGLGEVRDAVELALASPAVSYLLVTLHRDAGAVEVVEGDLETGMRGRLRAGHARRDTLTNRDMSEMLRAELGLAPFACVGSNIDPADHRWLSYLVGACKGRDGRVVRHPVRSSGFERVSLSLLRLLFGRYPMYLRQSAAAFRVQLVLNALTGGDLLGNLRFLGRSLGRTPKAKRLVLQCCAEVREDGQVVHCDCCPDAVLRQGRLVPVCLGDCVVPATVAP